MKKHLAIATAAALFASVSAAGLNALHADTPSTDRADRLVDAGSATGMIVQIDPTGGLISVDGVDYMLGEGVSAEGLGLGDEVTVRFVDSDVPGQYIATSIETATAEVEPAAGTDPARAATEQLDDGVVTPGEATGLVTEVDAIGGIVVVDGVRYMLDEGVDAGAIERGSLVTVSFEEHGLGTELLATEIVSATN